jgi:hypothetical protein
VLMRISHIDTGSTWEVTRTVNAVNEEGSTEVDSYQRRAFKHGDEPTRHGWTVRRQLYPRHMKANLHARFAANVSRTVAYEALSARIFYRMNRGSSGAGNRENPTNPDSTRG